MAQEFAGKGSAWRCPAASRAAADGADEAAADATAIGDSAAEGGGPGAAAGAAAATADHADEGHPPTGPCQGRDRGQPARPRRAAEAGRGRVRGTPGTGTEPPPT